MNQDRFNKFLGHVIASIKEVPELEAYDLTEGSSAYDLLVLPMTHILYDNLSDGTIDGYIKKYQMGQTNTLGIKELVNIGAIHCVAYRNAQYTSGNITLCFSHNNVTYSGKKGISLAYKNSLFTTVNDIIIAPGSLTGPGEDGLYRSYPISVRNASGDSVPENKLSQLSNAPGSLIKIEHPALMNGIPALDAETFRQRIRNSIHIRQLVSYPGISNLMHEIAPSVKRFKIIGAGDKQMKRDTLYDVNNILGYVTREVNFEGKTSGIMGDNKNQAFKLYLNDPVTGGTPDPATIVGVNKSFEFSNVEYSDIAAIMNHVRIESEYIVFENFDYEVGQVEVAISDESQGATAITATEAVPDNAKPLRLLLIKSETNWMYNVIKSVDQSTITLYSAVPFAIVSGTMMVQDRASLQPPKGWYRADEDADIDPDVKMDWMTDNPRAARVEKLAGMEGTLVLGDTNPVAIEMVEVIEIMRMEGVDRFSNAVDASLNPGRVALVSPLGSIMAVTHRPEPLKLLIDVTEMSLDGTSDVTMIHLLRWKEYDHDTGIWKDKVAADTMLKKKAPGSEQDYSYWVGKRITDDRSYGLLDANVLEIKKTSSGQGDRVRISVAEPYYARMQDEHGGLPEEMTGYKFDLYGEEQIVEVADKVTVEFKWTQTLSDNYELEIRRGSEHSSWAEEAPTARYMPTSPYKDKVDLLIGEVYYWRVRAVLYTGGVARYSAWRNGIVNVGAEEVRVVPPSLAVGTGMQVGTSGAQQGET